MPDVLGVVLGHDAGDARLGATPNDLQLREAREAAAPVGPRGSREVVIGEPVRAVGMTQESAAGTVVDEHDDAELAVEVGASDRLLQPLVERARSSRGCRRACRLPPRRRARAPRVGGRGVSASGTTARRRGSSSRRDVSTDARVERRTGARSGPAAKAAPLEERRALGVRPAAQLASTVRREVLDAAARTARSRCPRRRWSGWTIAQTPPTSSTSVAQSNSASPQPTIRPCVLGDPDLAVRARRDGSEAMPCACGGREPRAVLGDQRRALVGVGVLVLPEHGASIGFAAWRRPRS